MQILRVPLNTLISLSHKRYQIHSYFFLLLRFTARYQITIFRGSRVTVQRTSTAVLMARISQSFNLLIVPVCALINSSFSLHILCHYTHSIDSIYPVLFELSKLELNRPSLLKSYKNSIPRAVHTMYISY